MTPTGQAVRDFTDGSRAKTGRTLTVGPSGTIYVFGDRLGAFGPDGSRLGVSSVGQSYSS